MTSLVIGAKDTSFPGWVSTDLREPGAQFDVRVAADWACNFPLNSIDRIVAEHMLEHMSYEDGLVALCNIRRHLKPGGYVRIAVPDAFNPNPAYQEHCRPGGKGQAWARLFFYQDDEPEHKVHYDYQTLSALMQRAGLAPNPLEYYDEAGIFQQNQWSVEDAPVRRYYNSPYNLQVYLPFHGFQNLSLIVDGIKSSDASDAMAGEDVCEVAINQRAAIVNQPAGEDSTGKLFVVGALVLIAIAAATWD